MPPDYGPLQSGYDYFYGFRSGAVDYFTHKSGPPATGADDLSENDEKIRHAGYLTDLLGSRAVEIIDGAAKSPQPFFISLHSSAPHWPWEAPGDEAASPIGRVLQALDASGSAKTPPSATPPSV